MTYSPKAGIWFADAVPSSSHSLDYEGGTNISGFTEWDHGNRVVLSQGGGHMIFSHTSDSTLKNGGAYKAAPGSEYAFYAKLSTAALAGNFTRFGVMLLEDGTSSTGDVETGFYSVSEQLVYGYSWSDYATAVTKRGSVASPGRIKYFRCRVSGTLAAYDFAEDGVSWTPIYSRTLSYTPLHFGVFIDSELAGSTPVMRMRFLRVFEFTGSSGQNATSIGR